MEATKNCYLCGLLLPLSQFNAKRKECKSCSKGIKLIERYGITREQYETMLIAQGGTCAICPYVPKTDEMLAVDHNHKCCSGRKTCGKCLRRLLCSNCNTAIGLMQDDTDRLMSAIEYLKSFEGSLIN